MSKTFRKSLLATTIIAGVSIAAPAFAQDAAPAPAEEATSGDIVVTGSLIRNPNLERSAPVNVTTSDEIELKQSNVAEEILREIPGVVPSIGSAVNNGNGGASFVNLRGLGSNRNIVIIDGVRLVPAELNGRFDLNNIPLALIERVDVLTGGASTTYGADAISGVVNFITKQDFAGVEATASEQITEEGDGNIFRTDVTIGANFDDGRGNAVFSVGYQEADPVYQGSRSFSVNQVDSYSGGIGGSGTSVPARFSGVNPLATNNGGGTRQVSGSGFATTSAFTAFNFNPYNIFQTPFERFNIYGAGHYDVSDAVQVYTRGLFSKNTVSTIIAPSGAFGLPVVLPLSNPFLTTAQRNAFCAFDTSPPVRDPVTGAVISDPYTPRFTQAQCDAAALATSPTDPNYRTVTTNLSRRAVEFGPRISDFTTTFFDYRLGARGAITDTINWDMFGSYGQSENNQTQQGYYLNSRVRQALLATNTTTCLTDTNGCVPLNVFGAAGSITPAMNAFLSANSQIVTKTSLAQARATVNGDFGGFAIPWASDPIAFAVGGEYRKYQASQQSDLLSQSGDLGGAGGAAPNIDGGYDVYEAFGELVVPLIQDRPFFEDLTAEAGIRYSDYKVFAPGNPSFNTTTWKAGGSWTPIGGFKLRGNYSHAVRAPNIAELFSPVNTGLTNLGTDPCAGAAPNTNANLRAICLAQGAPAGSIGSIANPSAAQANATGGGNLNLKPEKSNSYTIGAVWQPEFVRNLSLSVDYYNIKVTGAITSPTPGDAIAACFGNITAASATDPSCTIIRRNPLTGGLDGDSQSTPGLFLSLSNLGKITTDGIDVSANWKTDLGFADLALNFSGNWTNSSKFQATANSLDRECVGYYSVNCGSLQPKYQFSQRTTLGFDKVDVSLLWRYIDKMKFEPQQLADDIAAAVEAGTSPTVGCPDPTGTDPNGCVVNPEFREIKAEHYFDLSTRFAATDNLTITVTVQNLFDNQPKVVGNSIGSTTFNSGNIYPSTYDALGRRFAVSAKVAF